MSALPGGAPAQAKADQMRDQESCRCPFCGSRNAGAEHDMAALRAERDAIRAERSQLQAERDALKLALAEHRCCGVDEVAKLATERDALQAQVQRVQFLALKWQRSSAAEEVICAVELAERLGMVNPGSDTPPPPR